MNANIKQYFVVGANGVRHTITMRKDKSEEKLSVYPPPKLAVVQGRVTRENFDLFVKKWSDYRDMSMPPGYTIASVRAGLGVVADRSSARGPGMIGPGAGPSRSCWTRFRG